MVAESSKIKKLKNQIKEKTFSNSSLFHKHQFINKNSSGTYEFVEYCDNYCE